MHQNNYLYFLQHNADETGAPYPQVPILFNKFNNTLTGYKNDIAIPRVTEKLDCEVELGVVIGKKAKYVSKTEALDYVFGNCTANDLFARDLQLKTPQWLLGKPCDDLSPVGPYLVTSDEVEDPQKLALKTIVNGDFNQEQQRKWHEKNNIKTQSWSPLARANEVLQNNIIQQIAYDHNKSISQVILRWHYQLGAIVIPKSSSPARKLENISIFDFSLDEGEMSLISGLTRSDGRINNQDPAIYEEF